MTSDALPLLSWLVPVAYAIHELEEWNILGWEQRHFTRLPPSTDASIRVWLLFSSGLALLATALLWATGDRTLLVVGVLAFGFLGFAGNALQHVYWLFRYREYAPGVATAVGLVIPAVAALAVTAVATSVVPAWYPAALTVPALLELVATVRAGDETTPVIRGAQLAGIAIAERLGLYRPA